MPEDEDRYEYVCEQCGEVNEEYRTISQRDAPTSCVYCGGTAYYDGGSTDE